MSALAVMFIAMGIADACRRLTRVSWVPVAIGVPAVIACAALSGLRRLGDVGLLAIAAAATVGWELLCARAERTGRLLGPMERLLIFGLGLGGQLAAATAVVAAKSIIRFPELNAQKGRENGTADENGTVGIDDVTEYFLVGSFASWLLSLACLALVIGQ
jgi:hypothetical protein